MAQRTIAGLRLILTGASSGIGAALGRALVAAGARVVLVARRQEPLESLAAGVAAGPGSTVLCPGDITSPEVRARAVSLAQDRWGGLDGLINNAGIGALARFADSNPERLRQIMEVNFFAPVELVRLALPLLHAGQRPIIVNIGSILGHRGIPRSSEYCASKFALRGWSESLRAELAPQGIDLLLVSPGTVATEFFDHALQHDSAPWGNQRGVTPEYVAQQTLRAMALGKHEIILNRRGLALVWLNRFFPRLVDRLLVRYG